MKKAIFILTIFTFLLTGCMQFGVTDSTGTAPQPSNTAVAATATGMAPEASATTVLPSETATELPPTATATLAGTNVFYGPVSMTLPLGLTTGISGTEFPRAEGDAIAPWEVTPGHIQIDLAGYLQQSTSLKPQIFVYPATDYGLMYPAAFESIHRLNNILGSSNAAIDSQQLPGVPFFNAQMAFAADIQVVSFQNGKGVRFLTEYAQYAVSANNTDLFYNFIGITDNGASYVIVVLPLSAPGLAQTSDPAAVLPAGGIPYPDTTNPNADWQGYYTAITDLLNNTAPDAFAPTLGQLDLLVQSLKIG